MRLPLTGALHAPPHPDCGWSSSMRGARPPAPALNSRERAGLATCAIFPCAQRPLQPWIVALSDLRCSQRLLAAGTQAAACSRDWDRSVAVAAPWLRRRLAGEIEQWRRLPPTRSRRRGTTALRSAAVLLRGPATTSRDGQVRRRVRQAHGGHCEVGAHNKHSDDEHRGNQERKLKPVFNMFARDGQAIQRWTSQSLHEPRGVRRGAVAEGKHCQRRRRPMTDDAALAAAVGCSKCGTPRNERSSPDAPFGQRELGIPRISAQSKCRAMYGRHLGGAASGFAGALHE
mmetsp:Transcript_126414/g.363607  ORF Transcript_126414/g.363607 Transcript_126414/m.363607 type:complete len:287 (+) Transcript_126414:261-1121(+)